MKDGARLVGADSVVGNAGRVENGIKPCGSGAKMNAASDGGRQIFVGTQANPNDRMVIKVSEADYDLMDTLIGQKGKTITITDLSTNRKVKLQSAPCGLGCHCAVDFVRS